MALPQLLAVSLEGGSKDPVFILCAIVSPSR